MASIREMRQDADECRRQNPTGHRLPDFCNLGVWLRALLAVNGLALLAAIARASPSAMFDEFLGLAMRVEPVALASLALLCATRRGLDRLPMRATEIAAVGAAAGVAAIVDASLAPLAGGVSWWAGPFWAALSAVFLLAWFRLQARARTPAVTEARLMALTARIRPHFLFNSLNAILGVIRSDPRRAEAALEELSDLFRALMRENTDLIPLSDEIALARRYLEIEKLRLGDRLLVRWEVETCPPDALVPSLMLQPLLENAVYHGVEPAHAPGEIVVRIAGDRQRVVIEIENPCSREAERHPGNRMALANIRERLMLFFDLEARLDTELRDDRYRVRIEFPYRREARA